MPLTDPQAFLVHAARRRRRNAMWLAGVDLLGGLLLATLVWQVLSWSRGAFEEQAQGVADSLAAVAKLNVESEIDKVDVVIRATVSELERLLSQPTGATDEALNAILEARYGLLTGAEAFRLTDADGLVRWGTGLPPGAPTNLADREHFRAASRLQSPATLVGGPLRSRISGNSIMAFMRPVHASGKFAGAVYVSINADHFKRMFQRYDLGPRDAVTLRRDDHRLVARHSPGSVTQGYPGDTAVSPQFLEVFATHPKSGTFVSTVVIDGEERTTAYRSLDAWPFVVLAGVNNERYFAPWRKEAWLFTTLSGLAWLAVVAASWRLFTSYRREAVAMQAVADQGERIRELLRAAGDGIHITDASGHLVEMSDSFAEMLGVPRERLLGRHISTWDANQDQAAIDAWLATVKPGDRQRVDVQHRRGDGKVIDVELQLSVAEISGRVFVFSSARDVTTTRRLMREQQAMLDSDLVGMAKVEDRVITWRNPAAEHILGYEAGELQGQPARVMYWDEATFARVGTEASVALEKQGQYRTQLQMRRKSGEPVWIDFGAVPLSDSEVLVMLVDITAIKQANDKLSHAAFHDALTQLPNRVLLHDRIQQALAVSRREGREVAICYLDLDGFKAVNDVHGHDAGDQLLKAIASRLLSAVRPSDTASRLGGDEFVLVLACIEKDDWRGVLERVMANVAQPVVLASGTEVAVGVTAGVAVCAPGCDGVEPHTLIDRADHVMLRGKRRQKGGIFVDGEPDADGS